MSLLSICQNVLAETGWPKLNSVASNTDATAQQIFTLANTELQAISELLSWPHLEVEYPFSTAAAQSVYLWPSDFRVLAPNSIFNASEYYGLKGSTGLQFWELLKYGNLASLSHTRFRVTYPLGLPGIEITPTPDGVQDLIAVYYSKDYVRNGVVTKQRYDNDADVSKVPERYIELGVKWRFRRAKGLDFSAELAEYNSTVLSQFTKYLAPGDITVGGRRPNEYYGLTPGYVPYNGFGS